MQARAVKAWLQEVFDTSFRTRRHGEAGGGNGAGSTLEATAHTRKLLAGLILRLNASSLIDVGCGTMFWQPALLQEVWAARPGFRYLGVDIAAAVLEQNRRDHPAQNDTFRVRCCCRCCCVGRHCLLLVRLGLHIFLPVCMLQRCAPWSAAAPLPPTHTLPALTPAAAGAV